MQGRSSLWPVRCTLNPERNVQGTTALPWGCGLMAFALIGMRQVSQHCPQAVHCHTRFTIGAPNAGFDSV